MLSFHRAQPMRVDRKTGRKTIRIDRASVSYTGGMQPPILRKILKANGGEFADNGMLSRFLMTMPPAVPLSLDNPAIDPGARERLGVIFRELLALMPPVAPGEPLPAPAPVMMDADACAFFRHLRLKLNAALMELDSDDPIRHVFPKIEGYSVRLAGALHLARWKDPANEHPVNPAVIDGQSMAAGMHIAVWFLNEARRIYAWFRQADAMEARPTDMASKVNAWINQKGGRVRVRDLNKKFGRAFGWMNIEHCVTWLNEMYIADGLATLVKEGKSRILVMAESVEPKPERPEDEEDDEAPAPIPSSDPIPW